MGNYKYLNTTIEIAEDRLKYNEMRQLFNKLAMEAQSEFRKVYSHHNDIESVVRNVAEQGATIFTSILIKDVMPMIIQTGIYNVDEETFLREYYFTLENNYTFDDAVLEVSDAYFEIVMDKATLDAYRVARRESRGRFVGGGFGISGAAKGMLLAGAGNMVTGGFHRVANGVGGMISSIKTEGKKMKLFNDSVIVESLCHELFVSVARLHIAYYNFLIDNFNNVDIRPVSSSEAQQANAILRNVQSNRVEENKVPYLLAEAIQLDPYKFDIYRELIIRYGDNELGIAELGEVFGFKGTEFKVSLLDEFSKKYSITTKQLALQAKYEFNKYKDNLGIKHHEFLDEIDRVINEFSLKEIESKTNLNSKVEIDKSIQKIREECNFESEYKTQLIRKFSKRSQELEIESRTLDGIVYSTEVQAQKARREKEILIRIEQNIDFECLKSLIESQKEVQDFETVNETYKKYLEDKIKNQITKIDLRNRTVDNILYSSLEEAEKARGEKEELEIIFNKINYENENEMIAIMDLLESKLEDKAYVTETSIESLQKKIKQISSKIKKKRTVEGIYYDSFEQADEARDKASIIIKIISESKKDFNKLVQLKKDGIECDDERLRNKFKKNVDNLIQIQIQKDEKVVKSYENMTGSMIDDIVEGIKSAVFSIVFFIILLFVFNATWIKVICVLGIIGSVIGFFSERIEDSKEKRTKKAEVNEAKKRLKLIEKI